MKGLYGIVFSLFVTTALFSQPCMPNDTVVFNVVYPLPETPDHPERGIDKIACNGLPYEFTITLNVPASFQSFSLDSVVMSSSGAITNLPTGIAYVCNPPNCHFKSTTKGCIKLTGTPNAAAQDYDLKIKVNMHVTGFPFPVPFEFPSSTIPGNYYLTVSNNPADCTASGIDELNGNLYGIALQPNPVQGELRIQTQVQRSGVYQLEVLGATGQRLSGAFVDLNSGDNSIALETSSLPQGLYVVRLFDQEQQVSRRFVKM